MSKVWRLTIQAFMATALLLAWSAVSAPLTHTPFFRTFRSYLWLLSGLLVLIVLFWGTSGGLAATAGFELPWWTLHSGGLSSGGSYTVYSAAGQPVAGSTSSGGVFSLDSGFLQPPVVEISSSVWLYLPLLLR